MERRNDSKKLGAPGIDWYITVKVGSTLFIRGPEFVPISLDGFTFVQVRQRPFWYKLILLVHSMCTTLARYCPETETDIASDLHVLKFQCIFRSKSRVYILFDEIFVEWKLSFQFNTRRNPKFKTS